jgi:hypothetical protein
MVSEHDWHYEHFRVVGDAHVGAFPLVKALFLLVRRARDSNPLTEWLPPDGFKAPPARPRSLGAVGTQGQGARSARLPEHL